MDAMNKKLKDLQTGERVKILGRWIIRKENSKRGFRLAPQRRIRKDGF